MEVSLDLSECGLLALVLLDGSLGDDVLSEVDIEAVAAEEDEIYIRVERLVIAKLKDICKYEGGTHTGWA